MAQHQEHSSKNARGHAHGMAARNLAFSIVLNVAITIAQFIGGIISGSLALLSDALHNFSDVISLVISYIANKVSKKEADFSKTFGYKRAEIIAAFINAATLIVLAIYLIKESVIRFFDETESIASGIVIWMAVFSIIANGLSVLLLYNASNENMNIRSSYLHLLTDMFTSVVVMFGGILMMFYEIFWIDSVLTFIIGAYLIYMGYDLLKNSFKVLMLFSPEDIPMEKLVARVNALDGVKNIHHIHIWLLNEYEVHIEAHVDMQEDIKLSEFDEILIKIEKVLHTEFGINHINIQPEYDKPDSKSVIVQD